MKATDLGILAVPSLATLTVALPSALRAGIRAVRIDPLKVRAD
jgi:hypothetical protein